MTEKKTFLPIAVAMLLPTFVFALPELKEVAAGQADISRSDSSLTITTSDKAILNYESFNIEGRERVQFVQPSSSSTVLNRVVGKDPSSILGSLNANGKVFLVNPNGVYFGRTASVNVGSLVVSTLDIADSDFLNDKFNFTLQKGSENASIINYGHLAVAPEGCILLMAPHIKNEGTLVARAGKVAYLSGEKISVDFVGDGLMSFTVEGKLEKALIEHLGSIQAPNGDVFLKMRTADRVIQEVLNTDGVLEGVQIVQENGVIRIASESEIIASRIETDAPGVKVEGRLDVSDRYSGGKGGTIHLLGDSVSLWGASIDASGDLGGGTVLVGGDYKGEGTVRNSLHVGMDDKSYIRADSRLNGDGGKVILWADDSLVFKGKISAEGGIESGNGGFVETSFKNGPGQIKSGNVSTFAPQGKYGQWLLDPLTIVVQAGGGATLAAVANCADAASNLIIDPGTINAAISDVTLCATQAVGTAININATTITMANTSVNLTFHALNGGNIITSVAPTIKTRSGVVNFIGPVNIASGALTVDTTNASGSPGADINFSSTINGGQALTLTAGTGAVEVAGIIGGTTALTTVSITGTGGITLSGVGSAGTAGAGSFTAQGTTFPGITGIFLNPATYNVSSLTFYGSTVIGGTTTITTAGDLIIVGSVDALISNSYNLTMNVNTFAHNSQVGTIGSNGTIRNLSLTTTGAPWFAFSGGIGTGLAAGVQGTFSVGAGFGVIYVNDTVFTSGASHTWGSPVYCQATASFKSTGAAVPMTFSSTLDGVGNITLSSGGSISFGAIGTLTAPTAVYIDTATSVTANSTIVAGAFIERASTGANVFNNTVQVTGLAGITLNGTGHTFKNNVSTSSGPINITGPVTLSTNPITFQTTSAGTGAPISFSSTINGAQNLNVQAGVGSAYVGGVIGGTTPLGTVTIVATGGITVNSVGTSAPANGATSLTLENSGIGGAITLSGTVYRTSGLQAYNGDVLITAGPVTFSSGGPFTVTGSMLPSADNMYQLTIDNSTTNASVTVSGGIGISNGFFGLLSINTGTGVINIGDVGSISLAGAHGGLTLTSSNIINLSGTLYATSGGAQTYAGPVHLVSGVSQACTFFTTNQNIVFNNTLDGQAPGTPGVVINAGTGAVTFNNNVGVGTAPGDFTIVNSGNINFGASAANFEVLKNTIDFSQGGPVVIGANFNLQSSVTGPGSIIVGNTINSGAGGPFNLTVRSDDGTVALNGSVGNTSSVNTLNVIGRGGIVLGGSSYISTLAQTYTGPVTLEGSPTITYGSASILTILGTIDGDTVATRSLTTTNGGVGLGPISITGDIGTRTPLGSLSITTGTGSISLASIGKGIAGGSGATTGMTLTTTGAITLNGAVYHTSTLPLSFPSTTGLATSTLLISDNQTISFGGTLNGSVPGAQDLDVQAGSGAVTFTGAVGAGVTLGAVTVRSTNTLTTNSTFKALSLDQVSTIGSFAFNGLLTATGAAGITLNTSGSFAANVVTAGGPIYVGNNVTLNAGVTLDTTNGGLSTLGAPVTIVGTVNSPVTSQAFTINAGTFGSVVLMGSMGNLAPALSSITVTGASTTLSGVTYTATGSQHYTSDLLLFTSATMNFGSVAGVSTFFVTGTTDAISGSPTLTVTNSAGNAGNSITFTGAIGTKTALGAVTLTGGTGSTNLGDVGGMSAGAASLTLQGTINLNGAIYNTTGAQSYGATSSTVTLNTAARMTTTNSAISFGSAGNPTPFSGGGNSLILSTGTSTIDFWGSVSSLGAVTITSANGVTAHQSFSAQSINETASVGANVFGSTLTATGAAGITLNGTSNTFNNNVTTSSGPIGITGPVTLATNPITFDTTNGGASSGSDVNFSTNINGGEACTVTAGIGSIYFGGNVGATTTLTSMTASGEGITLAGTTYTTSGLQSYTGDMVLANSPTITVSGASTATITGTVDGDAAGTRSLTITNGGGSGQLSIVGSIGTNKALSALTISAGSGQIQINNVGGSAAGAASLALTTTNATGITLNGAVYNTSGASGQSYSGNTVLTTATSMVSAGNPITFGGTLTGQQNLTLSAGAIQFQSTVGTVGTPLGVVTISAATSVQATGNFFSSALNETAATGANTFSGTLNTTGAGGIIINGTTVSFAAPISTASGGPVTIVNTTSLALPAAATVNITGAFAESGGGAVSLGANITTTADNISFADNVALTAGPTLTTGPGIGDIVFGGTVDQAFALSATAGTGAVRFVGAVGSSVALTSVTASGLDVVQASSVKTTGNVSYTGQSQIGGDILTTTGGTIGVTGPVTLTNALVHMTTNNAGVTLSNTVDGDIANTRSLNINSGTATTTISGVIGGGVPLNNLTINANLISVEGIGGLNNGVSGTLSMTSATSIDFNGTNYIANNQTYSAPTNFNMLAGSGTLFSAATGGITFTGGQIHLSLGTDFFVTTSNGNFTFPSLTGTAQQSFFVSLGSGTANLGTVSGPIFDVTVTAGSISYNGPINASTFNHYSSSSITNAVSPQLIQGTSYQLYNALGGTVGTLANPIRVNAPMVIAGATTSATFVGATTDGIIHCLVSNPPPVLTFNGSVQSCSATPIPPTPTPSGAAAAAVAIPVIPARELFVVGIYDPNYNLGDDFYMQWGLIDTAYMNPKEAYLGYIPAK
ncbi:MAG: filamentous hemagglutinin N-terminal domain-containing protein [Verrucomicrobia bacterium]|nr:filamentous hemagglutinin N-terminal domain-containing protein [Verrucomicrobiota bacterium]